MPRTPEQFQEIREAKKQLIMDAALELFATKGFYGTSISTIAKSVGISKGLLYNYFSGKEELVIEVMKSGFRNLMLSFDTDHNKILTKKELKFFVVEIMKVVIKNSRFWRLYFSVISQPIVNKVAFGEIMEIALPFFKALGDYFTRMGYTNPEAEARFFTALIDGVTLNYVFDPELFPIEKITERILEIYNLKDL